MMTGFAPSQFEEMDSDDSNFVECKVVPRPKRKTRGPGGVGLLVHGKESEAVVLNMSLLKAHFNLSLRDAAKALGVCVTAIKKVCRKVGIREWPFRKIQTLDRKIQHLSSTKGPNRSISILKCLKTQEAVQAKLESLREIRKKLLEGKNCNLPKLCEDDNDGTDPEKFEEDNAESPINAESSASFEIPAMHSLKCRSTRKPSALGLLHNARLSPKTVVSKKSFCDLQFMDSQTWWNCVNDSSANHFSTRHFAERCQGNGFARLNNVLCHDAPVMRLSCDDRNLSSLPSFPRWNGARADCHCDSEAFRPQISGQSFCLHSCNTGGFSISDIEAAAWSHSDSMTSRGPHGLVQLETAGLSEFSSGTGGSHMIRYADTYAESAKSSSRAFATFPTRADDAPIWIVGEWLKVGSSLDSESDDASAADADSERMLDATGSDGGGGGALNSPEDDDPFHGDWGFW